MIIVGVISALFSLGLYGVLSRRDIVGILASIEVMLGSATLFLVAVSTLMSEADVVVNAQAIGLFVIILAASEAAVGLALLVTVARTHATTRIDELTEVQG